MLYAFRMIDMDNDLALFTPIATVEAAGTSAVVEADTLWEAKLKVIRGQFVKALERLDGAA